MSHRTISGIMHVTVAVPFTAMDWIEEGEHADADAWLRGVNDGSLPDAMEGAQVPVANSDDHEVVDWSIESADYEPETHDHDPGGCTCGCPVADCAPCGGFPESHVSEEGADRG